MAKIGQKSPNQAKLPENGQIAKNRIKMLKNGRNYQNQPEQP